MILMLKSQLRKKSNSNNITCDRNSLLCIRASTVVLFHPRQTTTKAHDFLNLLSNTEGGKIL